MYLALYGVGRFFIEGLRTDSLWLIPGVIRVSQLLSAVLVVLGTAYLLVMHFRPIRAVHYYGVYSLGYKKPEKGEEAREDVNLAEGGSRIRSRAAAFAAGTGGRAAFG